MPADLGLHAAAAAAEARQGEIDRAREDIQLLLLRLHLAPWVVQLDSTPRGWPRSLHNRVRPRHRPVHRIPLPRPPEE